jgi:hypothetical protein
LTGVYTGLPQAQEVRKESFMLKAEKRHTKICKAAEYDRNHTKCRCPYRAVGMLNEVFIRKAPQDIESRAGTENYP